ncbi:MAG: rubrerythrin family protein [Clostridia bacterium]|nr:rubrerythrin family protein [Clostridia bacterium]MCR4886165.1 rubrerythrin family protein [Clostridiales bacterium]
MPAAENRLWDAFAAECAAYMKYTFYAQAARKEGFQQIADIFEETAKNEQAHARLWLTALGQLPDGTQPGDTEKCLRAAIQGERAEWTEQYPECAREASEAGDAALQRQFEGVGAVEASHEQRFQTLLDRLLTGTVFARREGDVPVWRCRFCGHLHTGMEAPSPCPVCRYPQTYFEINAVNY